MNNSWSKVTLGEVTTIINGGTPSTNNADYWGGEIVWITTTELTAADGKRVNFSSRTITQNSLISGSARMVRAGTTLVGTTATIGTCAMASCDLAFNQQISGLTPRTNRLDDAFLFYWIQYSKPIIESFAAGTSFKRISTSVLKTIPVNYPPLPEQKRIVDLISSADSYIEALQQQLDSVKRSRNAVLHELLTAGGDDWVETTIGEVVSVVNGGTPSTKSEDYWGGSIVWITTTELTAFDGKRVNSSKRTITVDGLRNGPARLVRAGTTLVGTTATIGTCALADCELTFNQQISGLIPLDKDLDDSYLFYWIQHIKSILEGLSAGTSFKRISTSVLKTVSINFPPIGEQKRIAAVISEMDEFIESIQRTSIEAKNLRSGLLSDLLSGTHEIPVTYDKAMGPA